MTVGYLHHDAGTVVDHLRRRGLLHLVGGATVTGELVVREVSDGNLNRVFLVQHPASGAGVAVKQALPWIRVAADWPLAPERIGVEVAAYRALTAYCTDQLPAVVPVVHDLDESCWTLVMADLSAHRVLRAEVLAGRRHPEVAAVVGRFCGLLAGQTGPLLPAVADRVALVERFGNAELRQMTVDVVLTEPVVQHPHNRHHPGLDDDVRVLRADPAVARGYAWLRQAFLTCAEALVHGDLHTGSLMVGPPGTGGAGDPAAVRVFDPEFAFIGPAGFDLGLYWGSVLTEAGAAAAADPAQAADVLADIAVSWAAFTATYGGLLAGVPGVCIDDLTATIAEQAFGFAGAEALRRVIGYSHAAELDAVAGPRRVGVQRWVLRAARAFVVERSALRPDGDGAQLLAAVGPLP